jgi:transcriptional activator for dhaKLM operon
MKEVARMRQFVQHQIGHQVAVNIDDFAGTSKRIQRMRYLAKTSAPARASILITGENGTGKDYLARALHNASPRRNGPFVIFGCSSVPSELIISELLGFEQRSAHQTEGGRPSKFELADGGTLFFQDIEVLPLEAQALLLNVLEFGIIQRLQGSRPIEVNVRLIASTTADLEELVAVGSFRADLYYRLSPFQIDIPPLRDRKSDFQLLVERILNRLIKQHQRPLSLAPGLLDTLTRYHWPGNVRELEAVLERGAVQSGQSEVIGEMHLPEFIRHPANQPTQGERLTKLLTLHDMEREAIVQAAQVCNGNVSQMAKVLGIGRTTLWRKLKDLNIAIDSFRNKQDAPGTVSN